MTSSLDTLICQFDSALKTLLPPKSRLSSRPYPAHEIQPSTLPYKQAKHVAGLMRVNHAGEVCAQALYQGQALTAKLPGIRKQMEEAAQEEIDHLAWCEQRLHELNASPSIFNPFWYAASFAIGALAGVAGDKVSLGFVAETEKQVQSHLQKHLDNIPKDDEATRAILKKMQEDEKQHADLALSAGALTLPQPIQWMMGKVSKIMTHSSYYI